MFLPNSRLFKFSWHSSFKIVLWNNTLTMKMFEMIFWSHSWDGFAMIWKWTCSITNAHVFPTRFLCNNKVRFCFPWGLWMVCTKMD
jgi:hypothetical protein